MTFLVCQWVIFYSFLGILGVKDLVKDLGFGVGDFGCQEFGEIWNLEFGEHEHKKARRNGLFESKVPVEGFEPPTKGL